MRRTVRGAVSVVLTAATALALVGWGSSAAADGLGRRAVAPGGRECMGLGVGGDPVALSRLDSCRRCSGARQPGPHPAVARRHDPHPAPGTERSRGHPGAARRPGPGRAAQAEVGEGRGALAAEPAGRSRLPGLGAAPAADRPASGCRRRSRQPWWPGRRGCAPTSPTRRACSGSASAPGSRSSGRTAGGVRVGRPTESCGGCSRSAAVLHRPGEPALPASTSSLVQHGHVVRRPALPVGRALGLRARLLRPHLARLPGARHHDPARRAPAVAARYAGRATPAPAT